MSVTNEQQVIYKIINLFLGSMDVHDENAHFARRVGALVFQGQSVRPQ